MSNPFANIITSGMKTLFTNAIDALLEDAALTLPCQLVFVNSNITTCSNCYFDPISGRSNNIYKTGGPIPFNQGNCPYCYGLGTISTDDTTNLNLIVLWNYKDWIGWQGGIPDNSNVPFGQAQTLSAFSTLSNIKRAKELIIATDISAYVKHRFERSSEPNPIGLGGSDYITTMWKRIG